MKKIIFGIFAHPDDEAFGPSGALLLEAQDGAELHLITLTNGDAGTNPDQHKQLGDVRLQEWRAAGKIIGAHTMHHLGLHDGALDNETMLHAAHSIEVLVSHVLDKQDSSTEIEFMTLDLNGMTGHIDHIVAARAACLAFYRLKAHDTRLSRIRFACLPHHRFPTSNINWLYMEAGRLPEEIDETVDARAQGDEIIKIVRLHHTQRHDGEAFLAWQGDQLGLCYFMVKT